MTSSTRPADGAASERLVNRHFAWSSAVLACFTWFSAALISSGRAGSLPTGRFASAWLILRLGHLDGCLRLVEFRLRVDAAVEQIGRSRQHASLLAQPPRWPSAPSRRARQSLPDACRSGGWRAAPAACASAASACDTAILASSVLHLGDRLACLDAVAALHLEIDCTCATSIGASSIVVAFDATDGERRWAGAGREQRGGERDRAEDAHGFLPFRETRIAERLSTAMEAIVFACSGPMFVHAMRRNTASRAMRK